MESIDQLVWVMVFQIDWLIDWEMALQSDQPDRDWNQLIDEVHRSTNMGQRLMIT